MRHSSLSLSGSLALSVSFLAMNCTHPHSIGDGGNADAASVYGVCPKGSAPPSTGPGCPASMPEAGSCCAVAGTACLYPASDDTVRDLALCIDDSVHAPFWQQTFVLDRESCASTTNAIALGSAPAPACAERKTQPCLACNCPPSDSLCLARCSIPSGLTTPQMQLNGDFADLVQSCGDLPSECSLQVNFTNGCATSLLAGMPGPPGGYDVLLGCIERALDSVHFECADSLECAVVSLSTLP
jgi:hypothetical protein